MFKTENFMNEKFNFNNGSGLGHTTQNCHHKHITYSVAFILAPLNAFHNLQTEHTAPITVTKVPHLMQGILH